MNVFCVFFVDCCFFSWKFFWFLFVLCVLFGVFVFIGGSCCCSCSSLFSFSSFLFFLIISLFLLIFLPSSFFFFSFCHCSCSCLCSSSCSFCFVIVFSCSFTPCRAKLAKLEAETLHRASCCGRRGGPGLEKEELWTSRCVQGCSTLFCLRWFFFGPTIDGCF